MEIFELMEKLAIGSSRAQNKTLFKSVCAEIDGVPTEVVYHEYTDRILLILTQYEKLGSIVIVEKEEVHQSIETSEVYNTSVILGSANEEYHLAARYLAEQLDISKDLCLFIALKSYDVETLKALKDIVLDLKRE